MITTVCKLSYSSRTVPPIVQAVQGDTGRTVRFDVTDFTIPAGAEATYFIEKPSGEAVYNAATISGNSILCELTAQSLAEPGENKMQVRVILNDEIVTSFKVCLLVSTFWGIDAIESSTEMNIFDKAVEQATEDFQTNAEQIVEEVIESIPADYTALSEEVDELNERLDNVDGKVKLATNKDFTESTIYLADGTTTTMSHRKCTDFISCDNYSYIEFKLRGLINPNIAIVSFFDASKNWLRCYSSPVSDPMTGKLPVPKDAHYLKGAIVDNDNTTYYINGTLKDTLSSEVNKFEGINADVLNYVDIEFLYPNPYLYNMDGTLITASQRYMCWPVDISNYDELEIKTSELIGTLNLNAISFLDEDLVYLSGVPSTNNGQTEKMVVVPSGAVYAMIPLQNNISGNYIHGIKKSSVSRRLSTIEALTGMASDDSIMEIVNPSMTVAEFRTAFNSALTDYATLTGCSLQSFSEYYISDVTWEQIYSKLNRVFRKEVYVDGMLHDVICNRVNKAFTENIWMWKDAKYNDGTARDFSLAFTDRSGEPSAIVSPDGGTLYVYGYNGRWATTDGLHWSEKETLLITGEPNDGKPEHANTNYIDGKYIMVGPVNTEDRKLSMFVSTDGINFEYKGTPLEKTDITVDGESVMYWGNSYIVKDADTYYLYIEAKLTNNVNFWDIYLCTCTDPYIDNGDGTVGNWVYSETGALVGDFFVSADMRAHGNPDFAKGPDNRPIRIDGKWYMYYHVTYSRIMYIYRASSTDLKEWTVEGRIINNRDVPTAGDDSAGNADHALIEFKGKTYLFYTWDINSANTPYIKYVVDDRPFRELLKMYP